MQEKTSKKLETIRMRIIQFCDNQEEIRENFLKKTGLKIGIFDSKDIDRAVGSDKISKILDVYPLLNVEWLITGNGEMLKNSTYAQDQKKVRLEVRPEDKTKNEKYSYMAREPDVGYGDKDKVIENLKLEIVSLSAQKEALLQAFERVGAGSPVPKL